MSTIYLFRHGITEGNKRGLYYGSTDLPLIEEGIEAIKIRREAGIYPEISSFEVITTDLTRTEQ
ncbi:MAG: phosphoglycerate mutase family protein, partial [Oscillospiraceae bacterium]|nr:phosphoglycerate mutase family protein [Oscillospiraceae bacterium]